MFTIIVELIAFKKKPHWASIVACVTICTGALVAGYETLAVDGYGYGLVLVANFLTSIFSVLQNWSAKYDRMRGFEMNCFIAFLTTPFTTIYCAASGEFGYLWDLDYSDHVFVIQLILSAIGGVLLCLAKIGVNVTLMPVTVSVLGVANHIMITTAGFILFKDVAMTVYLAVGISIALVGIIIYTGKKFCVDNILPSETQDDENPKA